MVTPNANFRATVVGGLLRTSWNIGGEGQWRFKISVTRLDDETGAEEPEPSYGSQNDPGQFHRGSDHDPGNLQAHWVYQPNVNSITWGQSRYGSGRVCQGRYKVVFRYQNAAREAEFRTETTLNVRNDFPCVETGGLAEMPAPLFTAPARTTAANHVSGSPSSPFLFGANDAQVFTWTLPQHYNRPAGWKLSIFKIEGAGANTYDTETHEILSGTEVRGTWRDNQPPIGGSHWIYNADLRTVTFSDDAGTTANPKRTTGAICPGLYMARLRYRYAPHGNHTPRSAAAVLYFRVAEGAACTREEVEEPVPPAPPIPEGQDGVASFLVGPDFGLYPRGRSSRSFADRHDPNDIPRYLADSGNLDLRWQSTFRSGLPQAAFKLERRFWWNDGSEDSGQQPIFNEVTHYFNGLSEDAIWSTDEQQIPSAAAETSLVGDPPAGTNYGTNGLNYWWGWEDGWFSWVVGGDTRTINGTGRAAARDVHLRLTVYDTVGNSAQTEWLVVRPTKPVLITSIAQDTTTITSEGQTRTVPRITIATDENTLANGTLVKDIKLALYTYKDDTEGLIEAGTVRFRGQPLDAPGAHWTSWENIADSTTRPATYQLLITPSNYMSNAIPSGPLPDTDPPELPTRFLAAAKVRDLLDRESEDFQDRQTTAFNWTPPAPRLREIKPVRITDLTDARVPVFTRISGSDNPLQGLAAGVGIGIFYYEPATGVDQSDPTPNDAIIERREFSRNDGRPLSPTEETRFVFGQSLGTAVPIPPEAGVTGATLLAYFSDFDTPSGVQFEYRATLIDTRSGGRRIGPWVP